MRMQLVAALLLLTVSAAGRAQTDLQAALKDTDLAPHWIYDDLPKAMARAKAENKPVLVVLRCVPCPPGRKLDVPLMNPDAELEKLEKQFVCVRVVQTKGLDLKLFQYDYDQSFAAMFLNADGTVYGRYGTRAASGPKSDTFLTLASFRKAAERVLELHKGYPGNRKALEAKTGGEPDYPVPEVIPGLQDRAKGPVTRQNCIHCHMVKEYALRAKWEAGKLSEKDLWVYPLPDNFGLTMDLDDGLRVKSVAKGSPAFIAGVAAGDELVAVNGQPLVSLADIQWVLHTAPAETLLTVLLRREGKPREHQVLLTGKWKESDLAWRASSWYGLRQGLKTEPLSAAEKKKLGLDADALGLAVKGLFGKGGPKLQAAGLKVNDIIVAVDGKTEPMTETDFLVNLRLKHGPKDSVTFTLLRGDKRQDVTVPMW